MAGGITWKLYQSVLVHHIRPTPRLAGSRQTENSSTVSASTVLTMKEL